MRLREVRRPGMWLDWRSTCVLRTALPRRAGDSHPGLVWALPVMEGGNQASPLGRGQWLRDSVARIPMVSSRAFLVGSGKQLRGLPRGGSPERAQTIGLGLLWRLVLGNGLQQS